MLTVFLKVLLFLRICNVVLSQGGIEPVFEWRRLQYLYENEEALQEDLNSGAYDPDVPAPIDVDIYFPRRGGRPVYFITIPKFQNGVPATFATVSDERIDGERALRPFPSWDWHRNSSECKEDRLVSVYRVKIDHCGQLWILDSGNTGDDGVICPPQVLVFDLRSNWERPVYRYEFDESVYDPTSILLTIQLDQRRECRDTVAFIADTITNALVVLDTKRNVSWRLRHSSMNESSEWTTFNISGDSFELDDGILGMGITHRTSGSRPWDDARYLLYSPMAGNILSRVSTRSLRQSQGYNQDQIDRIIMSYPTGRRSQSAAMDVNRHGVAVFGLMSNVTINCWDTGSSDYGPYIRTIYENPVTMQFASGLKIRPNVRDYGQEYVYVLTSRFQRYGAYNFSEVNFRVSRGNLDRLLYRSGC